MLTGSLGKNNQLVRKTILRMYPASFMANLTTSIALMMDTLLAGAILGKQAIAAVAIGLPAIGIFQALTQTIINGSGIKMATYAGRGEQDLAAGRLKNPRCGSASKHLFACQFHLHPDGLN